MSEIIKFEFPSNSFFVPAYTITCFLSKLDLDLTRRLAEIVTKEEYNILTRTARPEFVNDPSWLTGRLWEYNFLDFDYPEIREFEIFIKEEYLKFSKEVGHTVPNKTYVHCWANVLRKDGRPISVHHHADGHIDAPQSYSYLSGNISLQAEGTKTYYENPFTDDSQGIVNVPGDLVLFPSNIRHCTDANESDNIRISLAFDIITEEVYNMKDNVYHEHYREFTYEQN
jgi:hypothetical protein